jgi:tetratricopeptide (TPR) repeat protein
MVKTKTAGANHEELFLTQLCDLVISMAVAYGDVSEFIENWTYALCEDGKCKDATDELKRITEFFESLDNKNQEYCRNLADIYILIGEVNQYIGRFKDSIEWFKKAVAAVDRYAMPYHNLATSYIELGDIKSAIKSLEQEIAIEPGNYFSRLKLADLYEQHGEYKEEEECIESLLSRNPDNIQALHKLIVHYEKRMPHVDVKLLRRKLLGIKKNFNEIEIVIKAYHLCMEKQYPVALEFLDAQVKEYPAMTILFLVKAFVFGEVRLFSKKRMELIEFKQHCHGKTEYMKNKLEEFEHVFGKKAVTMLGKTLMVTNPNINRGGA